MKRQKKSPEIETSKEVVSLLRQLVAIELWNAGLSQGAIGRRLGIATATANRYVKGLARSSG